MGVGQTIRETMAVAAREPEDPRAVSPWALCAVALCFALLSAVCAGAVLAQPAQAYAEQQAAKNGLVNEGGQLHFYAGGTMVKNAKKNVNGATYYFNAKGNAVRGAAAEIGKTYWIFGNDGKLLKPGKDKVYKLSGGMFFVNKGGHPAKTGWILKGSKLRYVGKSGKIQTDGTRQGLKFASDGWAKDNLASQLKVATMKRIAKLTKPSWSRAKKLRKCRSWAAGHGAFKNSVALRNFDKPLWVQRQALKGFKSKGVECYSCACTFAMMAYELGYKSVVVKVKIGRHAYAVIDGKRWDWMGNKRYPGAVTIKVKNYGEMTPMIVKKASTKKLSNGWHKIKGAWYYYKNKKPVRSQWLTLKGARYYFTSSGKAASGSVNVKLNGKKTPCIFNAKGRLMSGSGTHMVTVAERKYQASKEGRAVSGWNGDKTRYFLASGEMATGACYVGKSLFAFNANGKLNQGNTTKLRKVLKVGIAAADAKKILGKEKKLATDAHSCRPSFKAANGKTLEGYGVERIYSYAGIRVETYQPPKSSTEYIAAFDRL